MGQVILSVMGLPSAHDFLGQVATDSVFILSSGIRHVLETAEQGQHIAPAVMEHVQDAISCLYYLVQHHGQYVCSAEPGDSATPSLLRSLRDEARQASRLPGAHALVHAAQTMFRALQGKALVREALSSAAVVAWAVAVLPAVPPQHTTILVSQGLFGHVLPEGCKLVVDQNPAEVGAAAAAGVEGSSGASSGLLDSCLALQGSSWLAEMQQYSETGKVCAVKGLMTSAPMATLCARLNLVSANGRASPWHFLTDGVLTAACQAVEQAPDSHYKFHAMCVVNLCLQQVRNFINSYAPRFASMPPALPQWKKQLFRKIAGMHESIS